MLSARMKRSSAAVIVRGRPTQRKDPVDCVLAGGATMKPRLTATSARLRTGDWADRDISETYAVELAGPFRAAFRRALFASP